ncbi:hypothetical protein TIFTF001_014191 [Ficus carica]|uniref:Myb/SANT-like domain-containing protein n=1 Tax=Ficus carica TaxID=3494 RepID=A0AA88D3S7_FICCA|nr:hypothetical protein TIFTF001_014191 [Ficus carica]
MRRRLGSAKQARKKSFISHYFRVRKASDRAIAFGPAPPSSTVYSSSGSNSEMPRKVSGETYVWNNAKEKLFLEKLDDFLMCNGGRHPTMPILDLWATQFNAEFGGVPAHGGTLYQKKDRMKRVYRGWKVLQTHTGLGYDPATDRVICSDEAWQSFIKVNKECNHLRHEGIRNKDLYYNVFEKSHAAGAFAFGSVTMGDGSTPSADFDLSMDNSGTHPVFEEEIDLTNGGR